MYEERVEKMKKSGENYSNTHLQVLTFSLFSLFSLSLFLSLSFSLFLSCFFSLFLSLSFSFFLFLVFSFSLSLTQFRIRHLYGQRLEA